MQLKKGNNGRELTHNRDKLSREITHFLHISENLIEICGDFLL